MTRAIRIIPEASYFEVDLDLNKISTLFGQDGMIVLRPESLDHFTDLEGRVVMVVAARNSGYRNSTASRLRQGDGHELVGQNMIYGDAYLVGEGPTEDGVDLIGLPEYVGRHDVLDLLTRIRNKG